MKKQSVVWLFAQQKGRWNVCEKQRTDAKQKQKIPIPTKKLPTTRTVGT